MCQHLGVFQHGALVFVCYTAGRERQVGRNSTYLARKDIQDYLVMSDGNTCFFGHPTSGSGGKKAFKRYLKSERTDRQTDRRTHRRTFRLIESIAPEGRCFEN